MSWEPPAIALPLSFSTIPSVSVSVPQADSRSKAAIEAIFAKGCCFTKISSVESGISLRHSPAQHGVCIVRASRTHFLPDQIGKPLVIIGKSFPGAFEEDAKRTAVNR